MNGIIYITGTGAGMSRILTYEPSKNKFSAFGPKVATLTKCLLVSKNYLFLLTNEKSYKISLNGGCVEILPGFSYTKYKQKGE